MRNVTLHSRFPQIALELPGRVAEAAKKGAERVADGARERVPVHTGRLHDAIHVEQQGVGDYAVIAGDHDAFYGHIVEHGGRFSPPHPFMMPAAEATRDDIQRFGIEALADL